MGIVTAILIGLPMTLLLTFGSLMVGAVLAPLLLALSSGGPAPVRLLARFLIDFIRAVPPLVWLFFIFFGVTVGGHQLTSSSAAIAGLGIVSGAYMSQILRGGFKGVPGGQAEAARALGLSRRTMYFRILAPQVLRVTLPALTSYSLGLLKDSSLAATIGAMEMVFQATSYMRQHPETPALEPFLVAAVIYALISIPLAILSRYFDARMSRGY